MAWGIIIQVALWVTTFVAGLLLRKKPESPKPGTLQGPTAEEGGNIPVIFGTVKIPGNVIRFGTPRVEPVTEEVGGLFGFGATDQVTGYKYYAQLQMALCHGAIDYLEDIYFGDAKLSDQLSPAPLDVISPEGRPDSFPIAFAAEGAAFRINAETLFGGDGSPEGGVSGLVSFRFGSQTQEASGLLGDSDAPAYRGLSHILFGALDGFYWGTSPSIRPVYLVLSRFPKCLLNDPEIANIDGDANPAEVIYETMIDQVWGCNVPANVIDVVSFFEAAETLKEEGTGYSRAFTNAESGDELIQDVLRHIDAALYVHPTTGLIGIRLIRDDYDEETLPLFDEVQGLEFSRASWRETINEIKLQYVNRANNFTPGVATAQNSASQSSSGDIFRETYSMPGITRAEQGQRTVERLLRGLSVPLAKARFSTNRTAALLKAGDPFVLRDLDEGIEGLVMRATQVNYGTLESGLITVDAIEDVFDYSGLAFGVPDTINVVDDPDAAPVALTRQTVFEAPYWMVGEERFLVAAGSRPSGIYSKYEAWMKEGAGAFELGGESVPFVPSGLLEARYYATTAARDDVGFIVTAGRDMDELSSITEAQLADGVNLAVIGEEIIAFKSIEPLNRSRYRITGILRGMMDTVPIDHDPLTPVYFFSLGKILLPDSPYGEGFDSDVSAQVKLKPINANGELDLADAPATAITTASRAFAPLPPGNVKLNGLAYHEWPFFFSEAEDAVFTWNHRNRAEQGVEGDLVRQDVEGAFSLEGSYLIEVFLVALELGAEPVYTPLPGRTAEITDETFTYSLAQRQADDADKSKFVTIRITPIGPDYEEGRVREVPFFKMEPVEW